MLVLDRPSSKQGSVSIDRLLLKETKGVTIKDKLVLFSLKNIYLSSRAVSMLISGKEKRDFLYSEVGTSFKSFLYKSVKLLRMYELRLKLICPNMVFRAIVWVKMTSTIL
jgi:hypothetical protein